ncbi:MAG: amidohydrolase family protein [Cyclobacteriaceae bacterium]
MYLRSMRGDAGGFHHTKFRDSLTQNNQYAPYLILSAPPFRRSAFKNADSLIQLYKNQGYDLVKVLSAPNTQRFDEIIQASKKYKIKVAGHNPAPFLKTLDSGFGCIEHLDGYSPYLKNDSINYVIAKTVKNNIYNCATLDWYSLVYFQSTKDELHKRAGLQYVSKKQLATWDSALDATLAKLNQLDEAKRQEKLKSLKETMDAKYLVLKELYDSNAKIILGGDATDSYQTPGFTVYDEMYHHKKAGATNYQVLRTATYSAAEYCDRTNEWGSVTTGKLANLVLLSKNPLEQLENIDSVEGVVINGNWLTKEQLNKRITIPK